MPESRCQRQKIAVKALVLLSGVLLILFSHSVMAQQGESRLVISGSDASSAPSIVLRAYGMDGEGRPLNLASQPLFIRHNGQLVSDIDISGDFQAGTLTVFLIDIPPGVAAQLPAIQQVIEQYTSPPYMEERVDYVAVYRVEETQAAQLLAPTNFYNSVRNFFASPLELQDGPTALVDSLVGLLNSMETLKPRSEQAAALVVFSDGTDVVSTEHEPSEVAAVANSLGIPVHTIWLENENLNAIGQESGREYLAQVAAGSRGLSAQLSGPDDVQAVWERIIAFRTHTVIQYQPDNLTGGEAQVVLGLENDPGSEATVTVSIPASAPSVIINLPAESRQLTLPALDAPIELSFSTSVSWIDGIERSLEGAELLVNGVVVQSIDPDRIERFTAEISNFSFGPNSIRIAIVDDQGQRALSPEIRLTISQGATEVPEEIQANGLSASTVLRVVLGCFVTLLLALLLGLIVTAARRRPFSQQTALGRVLGRLPLFRRTSAEVARVERYGRQAEYLSRDLEERQAEPYEADWHQETEVQEEWSLEPASAGGVPYLEILESVTRMPQFVELVAAENRIGRSPAQADVVFENDITVSRLHASIVLEGGEYRIYDEGSTSGTWVNDQPVPEYGRQLADGDDILLGAARMRFRFS